ncbi:MAG: DUF411 domain-containing protein [Gammaproteobacteria bacterium]|nr:MAG: DUF411 domain-containing protein [Gammaproteobacteria bacterium]
MKKSGLLLVLGSALLVAGCGTDAVSKESMTLYKSASCGCCRGWKDHMVNAGYDVNVVNLADNDLPAIKRKYGIPPSLTTCHTAVIGDYVVEGHIPVRVVDKLLSEQPEIDVIALAGMPSGSPGMPGPKTEMWNIFSLADGKLALYQKL